MFQDIEELQGKNFFKKGEQVFIHIERNDSNIVPKMHKHNFIEIVYIISGRARHYMGESIYEVRKGDLIIVNYGTAHTFVPIKDKKEDFAAYDLLFTNDFFEVAGIGKSDFSDLASSYLFYSTFPEDVSYKHSLNLIRSENKEFHNIFNKIYNEYTLRESGFMSMIRAYIIELITLIFREIDKKTLSDITKEQRDVVGKAIEYMKSNFNAKINLDDIVADIFLSKDYFRQLFKKTTGISITEYIQKTRVEAACKLLLETNRTVFDIAGDCGFSDIKFFYKTFKKITNKTPIEYRKEQGNNIEVQDD